jgi:uncharacterized protein RhaS with RHS repeats
MQNFNLTFIPNSKTTRRPVKVPMTAKGTRDALNRAGRILDLHRVRIITDPRGKHTATAYDEDGTIIGMVMVKHAVTPKGR